MTKEDEFLDSSGVVEVLPSRIDPTMYNYDTGNMIPGMIWYKGSRYTEFKYIMDQMILTRFEFNTQNTTWTYDGLKFTEGRIIRTASSMPQSSLVEAKQTLSPHFATIFNFAMSILNRIKDPEVEFITRELRKAWSRLN